LAFFAFSDKLFSRKDAKEISFRFENQNLERCSVEQFAGEIMEAASDGVDINKRQGMSVRAVGKQYKYTLFFGVDPQASTCKPKVAKALRRHMASGRRSGRLSELKGN
jgi:hypothetical protein